MEQLRVLLLVPFLISGTLAFAFSKDVHAGIYQGPTGNSCNFPEDDLRPHPVSCEKFLSCSNHIEYEFDCPDDLRFNPLKDWCDWVYNVPDEMCPGGGGSTPSSTVASTTTTSEEEHTTTTTEQATTTTEQTTTSEPPTTTTAAEPPTTTTTQPLTTTTTEEIPTTTTTPTTASPPTTTPETTTTPLTTTTTSSATTKQTTTVSPTSTTEAPLCTESGDIPDPDSSDNSTFIKCDCPIPGGPCTATPQDCPPDLFFVEARKQCWFFCTEDHPDVRECPYRNPSCEGIECHTEDWPDLLDCFYYLTCNKDQYLTSWNVCRRKCPAPPPDHIQYAFSKVVHRCLRPANNGSCATVGFQPLLPMDLDLP